MQLWIYDYLSTEPNAMREGVGAMFELNREQFNLMAQDLVSFVHRVSSDPNAPAAALAILPEVLKVLCKMPTAR